MNGRHQFLAQAKARFIFLADLGFRIETEREGDYSSFKDGFEVIYLSPIVSLRIAYYDMELQVFFIRGNVRAPYLVLDRNLFSKASGLSGIMFPVEKLASAIDLVARDIAMNYGAILSGERTVWEKITAITSAPAEKRPPAPGRRPDNP